MKVKRVLGICACFGLIIELIEFKGKELADGDW